MPHSSGGGSSYGGSHSGSSSHSSGSGHNSRRKNKPQRMITNHYFAGARRYRYYDHGEPHYIYSNEDPSVCSSFTGFSLVLPFIFYGIFYVIGICILLSAVNRPTKLSDRGISAEICIEDNAGVLSDIDEEELRNILTNFRDEKESPTDHLVSDETAEELSELAGRLESEDIPYYISFTSENGDGCALYWNINEEKGKYSAENVQEEIEQGSVAK